MSNTTSNTKFPFPVSWRRSVIVERNGVLEVRLNKHDMKLAPDERFVCVVNRPKNYWLCNQVDLINKRRGKV